MKKRLFKKYCFIIPLVLFICDYLLIKYGMTKTIDHTVYQMTQTMKNQYITEFFKLCSQLGSTYFYVTIIFILMIVRGKKELFTGIHLLIIQGINRIIKSLVKRPRPPKIYHLVKETNYSFPSGHSMSAMMGYGLFIIEVYHSQLKYKTLWIFLLAIMIGLIGLSRIYLGVHYFSDVIGGYLASLSYLLFVYYNTSYYVK